MIKDVKNFSFGRSKTPETRKMAVFNFDFRYREETRILGIKKRDFTVITLTFCSI